MVIITIAGFVIAFFPDINIYIRFIILLGTAIIVIFVKMCEVIRENKRLLKETLENDEEMNAVKTENKNLKKEIIEKEEIQNTIDEKQKELDSNLLKEIKKILNDYNTIEFIRTHDFAGAFRQDFTVPLMEYNHRIETDPEFNFLDSDLNKLKKDLDINIVEFLRILINKTFDLEVNKDLRGIPKDWREKVPERYEEAVDKVNHHADKIIENYDELLQLARKKAM